MIQSDKFDSLNMDIKKLRQTQPYWFLLIEDYRDIWYY